MKTTHLYASAVLIFISLFCLFWLIPVQTTIKAASTDLQPSFMPSLAISIIFILAVVMFIGAVKEPDITDAPFVDDEEFGDETTGIRRLEIINVALWLISSFAALQAMKLVGYIPVSALFLLCLMLYSGERKLWVLAAVSITTPVFLQQFSAHVLSVQLP